MIEKFIERENTIFEVLEKFKDEGEYVLVGGYAVSAFSHRFSVDADLVIEEKELSGFLGLLEKEDFREVERRELKTPYGGRFLSYRKREELPVTVDLLVNSLECRQTGAGWSYDYLKKHSRMVELEGSEKSLRVRVPEKELLIAIKLHSGRSTDIRDVVALASDVDLKEIREHLDRGNIEKLKDNLRKIKKEISSEDFQNSFKGVFSEEKLPKENVKLIKDLIDEVNRFL